MVRVVRADDGRRLSVETWGDPKGKPVFLMHGTPGSRLGPRPRTRLLYQLGIRLIAYDRPGYGDSDRLPDRSVGHAAADVVAIANALGIGRFAVAGRSGGGPHALACAALLPERVTKTAVLVGLAPHDAPGLDWFRNMVPSNVEAFRRAGRGLATIAKWVEPRAEAIRTDPISNLPFHASDLPAADQRVLANHGVRYMLVENFAEGLRGSAYGWIDDVLSFTSAWGFDPSEVVTPVDVWCGAKDVFVPADHGVWLAHRIPGARLTVDDEASHFAALEVMPEILRRLAFAEPDEPE